MNRVDLLKSAIKATTVREDQFGSPKDNLGVAADLWTQYLKQIPSGEISALDVSMMMVLFKVARIATGSLNSAGEINPPHEDTLRDIAGYAAIASELHH